MLYRILRGPKYGQTKHLPQSQEISLAVLLGDLEPVEGQSPDAAADLSRQGLLHPTRGWKIVKLADAQGRETYRIVFDSGTGERTTYAGLPGKKKVWRHDPLTQEEGGYVFEDSGCPPELCQQWEALNRPSICNEADGERRRIALNKLETEMKHQNTLGFREGDYATR